jgi:hypothetical protein
VLLYRDELSHEDADGVVIVAVLLRCDLTVRIADCVIRNMCWRWIGWSEDKSVQM